MRKVYCLVLLCLITCGSFAQHLATINGTTVSSKEFTWFYKKNHQGNAPASVKELEGYLDLYINFRLKAIDARQQGLDRDTAYLAEVREFEATLKNQKRHSASKPDNTYLLNEYKDAVLMFNLTEKRVWGKAQNDEAGLRAYFDTNKGKYGGASLDEVRDKVVNDYQQQLEDQWVAELRKKYPVKIEQDELRKLAKR
ncbi:hypothetical protein [Pedobacter sp. JY14-1]|uniref:hypothetical protein n=1 Tax=Pedobacter sp. JY14-1 TaxID=3034151 RepID=UPI0023E0DB7A|nr:hypothetical protein [Pedobacter sp. JY14-1]